MLKYVHYDDDGIANKCFLVIDYQSTTYTGCLICQDPSLSKQIAHVLCTQIGRSIEEIGDLDLSFTL